MKRGDLVLCEFHVARIPLLVLGVIVNEQVGIAVDMRFYNVLMGDGRMKLVPQNFLRELPP